MPAHASAPPLSPPLRTTSRASIATFLAITFLWAWALWGYWIPAMPATGLVVTVPFILCAIIGGFAPSLAAIVALVVGVGREAAGDLMRQLRDWRAPTPVYAVVLLLVPVGTLATLALATLLPGDLKPVDPAIFAMAAIWPIMAALGEELGWRGFLFPRLLPRFGHVGAGLIIGLVWGVWHLPADFVGLKGYGDLFWLAFLVNGPIILTAHALIMAWLWQWSGGRLPLMVAYHYTITACAMLVPTPGGQDWVGLANAAIGAGIFWLIALALWTFAARVRPAAPARGRASSA